MGEILTIKSQKIGTYFKKGSIFLGTISRGKSDTVENIKARQDVKTIEDTLKNFIESGFITSEEFDVFYKDEKGYTRFIDFGPETFAGDNSDGKGTIRNIVSIWEYYSENDVHECLTQDGDMIIVVTAMEPIYKYNRDYNKNRAISL